MKKAILIIFVFMFSASGISSAQKMLESYRLTVEISVEHPHGIYYESGKRKPFTGYEVSYFYPQDSVLQWKTHIVNGVAIEHTEYSLDGKVLSESDKKDSSEAYIEYFPNGDTAVWGQYLNGEKVQSWIYYNEDRSYTCGQYVFGKKYGVWGFIDSKGRRTKDIIYGPNETIEKVIEY